MNKDQFWKIIDTVNASATHADEESRLCRVEEALLGYSLEDIMDWYLIMEEYRNAAYRNDLWAVSAALDARYLDEGFSDFRSWLISRGKEVYMNAMQDPDSLAMVPRDGEDIKFKRFGFAAYYAYEAKLFRVDPGRQEDLFSALKTHTLDEQTIEEIRAELPQRQDIRSDWSEWMLPKLFPGVYKAREPKDMEGLLKLGCLALGYVYQGGQCKEYIFQYTPENLAYFIGTRPEADEIIVTDEMDLPILNTIGNFIDKCPSQELLEEVKKTLIPIQMGAAEAQPFFCPTMAEVEDFCMRQATLKNDPEAESDAPAYLAMDFRETV